MLLKYLDIIGYIVLFIMLLIMICAGYSYMINKRRERDDPEKRDYHPFAIVLAPFTFFIFVSLGIVVFIFRALLFAGVLIIFTILSIGLRKPFILIWMDKYARKIGEPLLKINTLLIRMALNSRSRPRIPQPA